MTRKTYLQTRQQIIPGPFQNTTSKFIKDTSIPESAVHAYGCETILYEAEVSKLNGERVSTMRHLVVTESAVYIIKTYNDNSYEVKRRIAKGRVNEVVTYRNEEEEHIRSHRFLIKTINGYDFFFIVKANNVARKSLSELFPIREVDPDVDLFTIAHLDRTTDYIKGISDADKILGTLQKAVDEKDKKTIYCYLERARTQLPNIDWDNNSVIKQAKQVAKELW